MKITITGTQLRAAMVNAATKHQRQALTGIYFDIENNKLVASNANHMCITSISCEYENGETRSYPNFILPQFKVTRSVTNAIINYSGTNVITVILFYKNGDTINQKVKAINEIYPDYQGAIPKEARHVNESYFNACNLAIIEKTFGKNATIKIQHFELNRSIVVSQKDNNDILVVMPVFDKYAK